jgi:hypothetical protein
MAQSERATAELMFRVIFHLDMEACLRSIHDLVGAEQQQANRSNLWKIKLDTSGRT